MDARSAIMRSSGDPWTASLRWTSFLALMFVAGSSLAADVTGNWVIASSIGEAPIQVHCRLIQSGEELTGTCTPVMENPETSELAGRIEGTHVEWSYDVVFNGSPGHVAYDGEILSDSSIQGTLDLSGTPTKFTATRQESE